MLNKLLALNSNAWKLLTVCKQINTDSLKDNVTNKQIVYNSYILNIYTYKEDSGIK